MASQKVANCCVAANCLVTAAYLSTPHSSKFARLAFDNFCLAIPFDDVLRIHQGYVSWVSAIIELKGLVLRCKSFSYKLP
jgi:hypothetical protein